MNPTQKQQEAKFKSSLIDFLSNTSRQKPNKFQYNAFKLYKFVCRQGGFQAVTNRNQWTQIASELLEDDANKLKHFYFKFVYPYEQKYYFGKQGDQDYPNLIYGNPRKIVKTDPSTTLHNQNNQNLQSQNQGAVTNLLDQISKNFQQQERQKKQFFLNKNKLNQTKTQTKKIILGLQSFMDRKDIIYSLNLLLLYSINNHNPFLLQNNQKIFNALSSYTQTLFPPKSEKQLEDLRTITLIFRNLTMNPINLKFILGTSIFQLFVSMFNKGIDSECSKNIVDIMTGLVKVGWDCERIFKGLDEALLNNNIDQIENAVQLLRGLVDQREQTLIASVTNHIKTLNRVLLSNDVSIQIKEQVFQILAFVSDVRIQSKQNLAKNSELIGIIMGIIQYMRNCQKLAQLSALTLNNLSTASGGKGLIKEYQSQLMTIGFSDDSLAGIIASILADLTSF